MAAAALAEVPVDAWRVYTTTDRNYLMLLEATVDQVLSIRENATNG